MQKYCAAKQRKDRGRRPDRNGDLWQDVLSWTTEGSANLFSIKTLVRGVQNLRVRIDMTETITLDFKKVHAALEDFTHSSCRLLGGTRGAGGEE